MMPQTASTVRKSYVQGDLYSATPQKIQLLLIEAAIKNVQRCKLFQKDSKFEEALEASQRAQDIVAEMLCCLDVDNCPEIAKPLASVYLFIFRRIAESGMLYDEQKLDDALRVLDSERETWRLACEKFGSTRTAGGDTFSAKQPAKSQAAIATASPESPRRGSSWDA